MAAWALMACCVIIFFSLCIPFVPRGHDAEFYSFVFIYIAIFLPGFAAYIASHTDTHTAHTTQLGTAAPPDARHGKALRAAAPLALHRSLRC